MAGLPVSNVSMAVAEVGSMDLTGWRAGLGTRTSARLIEISVSRCGVLSCPAALAVIIMARARAPPANNVNFIYYNVAPNLVKRISLTSSILVFSSSAEEASQMKRR